MRIKKLLSFYSVERSTRVTILIRDLNGYLIKVLYDDTGMPGLNRMSGRVRIKMEEVLFTEFTTL
jgi:hypothetical protein